MKTCGSKSIFYRLTRSFLPKYNIQPKHGKLCFFKFPDHTGGITTLSINKHPRKIFQFCKLLFRDFSLFSWIFTILKVQYICGAQYSSVRETCQLQLIIIAVLSVIIITMMRYLNVLNKLPLYLLCLEVYQIYNWLQFPPHSCTYVPDGYKMQIK